MRLREFRAKERVPHAPYHLLALAAPCPLLEKLCMRGGANRCNVWMRDSPLNRNRVEALDDTVHNADRPSMILTAYLCLDDRWHWEQPRASLAESLQQRTILELADDTGTNPFFSEPVIRLIQLNRRLEEPMSD